MPTTLTNLSDRILSFMNKTSSYPGFYDSTKVTNAVNTAMNYISVHMFVAGQGWLCGYSYVTTAAGDASAALPTTVALIRELRYKVGDIYLPMIYDDRGGAASYAGSAVRQQGRTYRLLGNSIIFDPPLGEGGTNYLQIEGDSYPTALASGSDNLNQQFDAALTEYLVLKACSVMAGSLEKEARPWAQEESEWYEQMRTIVARRNMRSVPIKSFVD